MPTVWTGLRAGVQQHPDVVFVEVGTEARPELSATFRITSIPTLMVVRDKAILYAQPAPCRRGGWNS